MNGDAGDFARDVPQRDVETRDGERSDPEPTEDVQLALEPRVHPGDIRRVVAHRAGRDHVVHRRGDSTPARVGERFTPADDAGVGLDAHEAEVERAPRAAAVTMRRTAVGEGDRERDRLDASDLHRVLVIPANAGIRGRSPRRTRGRRLPGRQCGVVLTMNR